MLFFVSLLKSTVLFVLNSSSEYDSLNFLIALRFAIVNLNSGLEDKLTILLSKSLNQFFE